MDNAAKAFIVGISLGALVGAYFGYSFGVKVSKGVYAKPELRIVIAVVVLVLWALAQLLSILFGTTVDPWLNTIMGIIVGFFFGDGIVEKYKKGNK